MTPTVFSLFSGIGGIDLGLHAVGFDTVAFCDNNPFPVSVLERRFPGLPVYPDVRALTGEDVGQVTCLAGGSPCQDVSLAGKRAGIREGTRSGLWIEFARLIEEAQPDTVLFENVGGLLTLGAARVVMDLVNLGHDVFWFVLSAAECGAPHLRQRFFALACRRDRQHTWVRGVKPNEDCFRFPPGPEDVRGWHEVLARHPEWAPALVIPKSGANRIPRIIAAGNAVVPQVAAEVGWRLSLAAQREGVGQRVALPSNVDGWPRSGCIVDGAAYAQRWPLPMCPVFRGPGRAWPTAATRDYKGAPSNMVRSDGHSRFDQVDRVAERLWWPTIGRPWFAQHGGWPSEGTVYVNPSFSAWLMGFHPEWTDLDVDL